MSSPSIQPGASRVARDIHPRDAVIVAVVAVLLVVSPLGQHLVTYSGEARMALLARDILERGTLFHARVEGKEYRNKPPLYPWTIALVSLPRGRVTEATAHVPVAAAAVVTAGLTWLLGARLFGRRAGLWAGLMLVTGAGFFSHSQVLLPDMLVAAFTTAAIYLFWRSATVPARGSTYLLAFYAAVGLAVFSKGPVGLLPLLPAAIWLWSEHGRRGLGRLWSPLGFATFAALTLAWLVPYLSVGAQTFGGDVLWEDWLSRYVDLPSLRRVGQFLVDCVVGFLPWSPLLALGLVQAARSWKDSAVRWAFLSFLVPLAVIVLSNNRQPIYLLPTYPAAAVLAAWWTDRRGAEVSPLARALAWVSLAGVMVGLVAAPFVPDVRESALVLLSRFAWKVVPLIAGVLAMGGLLFWGLSRGRPALLVYGGTALMTALLSVGVRLNDQAMRLTEDFRGVAAALSRHADGGEARLFSASLLLPVDFYFGHQLERMETIEQFHGYVRRPGRPVVMIDQRFWLDFRRHFPPDLLVLDKLRVQGQDLFIVRAPAAGPSRAAGACSTVAWRGDSRLPCPT